MAYEGLVQDGLDYSPCRYGNSRLTFRGPRRALQDQYVAFLGSTETYGKFVDTPYPELTGRALGLTSLNLGCVNAGIDTFHDDPTVQDLVRGARACVIQVMGAHKLTNRLYSVHSRRNDRFLSASKHLKALYPQADFADVHFTRHLLSVLRQLDEDRFEIVREELSRAWIARMTSLVETVEVPTILLWVSMRRPEDASGEPDDVDPLFVDRSMLDAVSHLVAGTVEVFLPQPQGGQPPDGMIFSEFDRDAAACLPGPACHRQIAEELTPRLLTRL